MNVIRFVLIGHVDHGKSSLAGHLLHLVSHFSEHEVKKTEFESKSKTNRWKWAYLLDTCDEERSRGKTHEFSLIPFNYKENKYELIDTPGHSSFVRSMIQGIGTYDNVIGVLVVSAIENEFVSAFERGMIKEHCILSRATGLTQMVVAINKMDAVNWDDYVYNQRKDILNTFLKSLQFKTIEFIKISAYDGNNVLNVLDIVTKLYTNSQRVFDKVKVINEQILRVTEIDTKCKILHCDNIITSGYQCIAHLNGNEYEVTLELKEIFIKRGSVADIRILFSKQVEIDSNIERIILRKDDFTIGFGKITQ